MKRRLSIVVIVGSTVAAAVVGTLVLTHRQSGTSTAGKPDANGVVSESVSGVKQEIASGALVLDVRKDDEWAAGRVPDSVHIPLAQVQDRFAELPKDRTIVTVCKEGGISYKAAYALRQAGYNAVNLAGGLKAWFDEGLPLVDATGAPGQLVSAQ